MKFRRKALLSLLLAGAMSFSALAQNFDDVTIKTEKVQGNIYVLFGAGGNIGVSVGEDGVFIVDDQFAPLTDKIKAAIAKLSNQPIRFAINTHFHGDHTGGNENFGKTGTVIVAHDNVRVRMSQETFIKAFNTRTPASPKIALPVVTFNDKASLHLNGEEARLIHVENAHTDGDSHVFFKASNVLHMGDTFFHRSFPFIDVDNGGSIDGMIESARRALSMIDADTKVIPGHGAVTDKMGLQRYLDVLRGSREIIAALKADGKSLEDIQAANPLADFADFVEGSGADWTNSFISFVFNSV